MIYLLIHGISFFLVFFMRLALSFDCGYENNRYIILSRIFKKGVKADDIFEFLEWGFILFIPYLFFIWIMITIIYEFIEKIKR